MKSLATVGLLAAPALAAKAKDEYGSSYPDKLKEVNNDKTYY